MEKFTLGMLIGGVVGALVVTNNYKARVLVKKGQDELKAKVDDVVDEKLRQWTEDQTFHEHEKTEKSK